MISVFASPVVLFLYAWSPDAAAAAQAAQPSAVSQELPPNIVVSESLRRLIDDILPRSQTVREQCAKIGAARRVHITIDLSARRFTDGMRARSVARRFASGLLIVDIELPIGADMVELLAHELEHVTELIESVDLQSLAHEASTGVTQRHSDGAFETERAKAAGRAAADETYDPDPVAGAIVRTVARGARAAWRAACWLPGVF